jgi:hypothetical protein
MTPLQLLERVDVGASRLAQIFIYFGANVGKNVSIYQHRKGKTFLLPLSNPTERMVLGCVFFQTVL